LDGCSRVVNIISNPKSIYPPSLIERSGFTLAGSYQLVSEQGLSVRDFQSFTVLIFLVQKKPKKYSRLVYPQSNKPFEPLLALFSYGLLSFRLHRLCRVAGLSVYSFRVLSSITFWSPRDPPSPYTSLLRFCHHGSIWCPIWEFKYNLKTWSCLLSNGSDLAAKFDLSTPQSS